MLSQERTRRLAERDGISTEDFRHRQQEAQEVHRRGGRRRDTPFDMLANASKASTQIGAGDLPV
jgi:hypothetical protein